MFDILCTECGSDAPTGSLCVRWSILKSSRLGVPFFHEPSDWSTVRRRVNFSAEGPSSYGCIPNHLLTGRTFESSLRVAEWFWPQRRSSPHLPLACHSSSLHE